MIILVQRALRNSSILAESPNTDSPFLKFMSDLAMFNEENLQLRKIMEEKQEKSHIERAIVTLKQVRIPILITLESMKEELNELQMTVQVILDIVANNSFFAEQKEYT